VIHADWPKNVWRIKSDQLGKVFYTIWYTIHHPIYFFNLTFLDLKHFPSKTLVKKL